MSQSDRSNRSDSENATVESEHDIYMPCPVGRLHLHFAIINVRLRSATNREIASSNSFSIPNEIGFSNRIGYTRNTRIVVINEFHMEHRVY